ncbi:hypothetical protein ACJIZ3_003360 [Penstemon smallii]|uniref:Pentatricopeptide repeat-containing protein n=1 Tax=Penstemon smallii TaxID=265156 RepID=A0ABD3U907_9LAMI
MCSHGSLIPNSFTFSSALTACAALEELNFGKSIQGRVIKSGAGDDVFVGTATVDLYAKCGDMCDAMKQLKLMPVCNVVSWTAIISGFAHKGDLSSAVLVLDEMRKTGVDMNHYTVSSLLAACAISAMFNEATQIHCLILKIGFCSNSVVKSSLITMYSKVGAIDSSEVAFSETHDLKQVAIWNNMISAYAQNNIYEKAIILLKGMLELGIAPDQFSTSSILSIIDSLTLGRQLHVYTLKSGLVSDVSVGSSILTMYSKCGELEESFKSFEQLEMKDNVTWTSMIAGFAEHGCADKAVHMFRDMFKEYTIDEMSLTAILMTCSALKSIKLGREIHGYSIRCGFDEHSIAGGLVNMYSKCGDLNSARIVFHMIPFKGEVSFSSLISGFCQRGLIQEALELFHDMLLFGMSTDGFTISSILGALASSNKSAIGIQLHAHIIKLGLESESSVGSSLIMMYSKHGNIGDCGKVFKQIKNPDLVTWTTMIASYAQHGKVSEALEVYHLMKKSGIEPDSVTFVGVLSACCHTGLVEEGYFHFNSMIKDYGIEPCHKHYTCMVNLLGRAGRLEEAERFIMNMHIEPDILIWETLLACCKVHGNHELGKLAAEKIMESQPSDAGPYISLSNICADVGEWDSVLKIRGSMKEIGAKKKEPGWSFV